MSGRTPPDTHPKEFSRRRTNLGSSPRFGKAEYARLAKISIGHLYNLRASAAYRKRLAVYESTRPTVVTIGERRRPEPRGQAGYLRVDTVLLKRIAHPRRAHKVILFKPDLRIRVS